MKSWWHRSENFGDCLTPYLIKKIYNQDAEYVEPNTNDKKICMTGSLLGCELINTNVWGLGVINRDTTIPKLSTTLHMVRGKISNQKIIDAGYRPVITGDPGIILPKFYTPKTTIEHKIGFIQSWVDLEKVKTDYPEAFIIDIMRPIEEVIDNINKCEKIIASCLHGMIAAIAYNKPILYVKYSDKMMGDGTKFKDFMSNFNQENIEPINLYNKMEISKLKTMCNHYDLSEINIDNILSSIPDKI
jgi:pyruvyltransferase